MLYALNLNNETNRILSATYDQYAPKEQPRMDTLPEGNIIDYLYVDGKYVYDPLPEPEPEPQSEVATNEQLQAEITDIQLALAEIYETMQGGN